MSRIAGQAIKYVHERDPREAILSRLGNLDGIEVHGPRVLVAVYTPGEDGGESMIETAGGVKLYMPQTAGGTLDEYKFQGRACLVLKLGPAAFKDDTSTKFHGDGIEVGSWVVMRPTDGNSVLINKQLCRVVEDSLIQMTIPDPDTVY